MPDKCLVKDFQETKAVKHFREFAMALQLNGGLEKDAVLESFDIKALLLSAPQRIVCISNKKVHYGKVRTIKSRWGGDLKFIHCSTIIRG